MFNIIAEAMGAKMKKKISFKDRLEKELAFISDWAREV